MKNDRHSARMLNGAVAGTLKRAERRHRGGRPVVMEELESRLLMSVVTYASYSLANAAGGISAAAMRHAYGFDSISFGGVTGNGSGQAIAIVDAWDTPDIQNDLHQFDLALGLSDPSFAVIAGDGTGVLPAAGDAGAQEETCLDVEWAHAMAPGAAIFLVESANLLFSNLMPAVQLAAKQTGVSVVSMSFGAPESVLGSTTMATYDAMLTTPAGHAPVSFVASDGDHGSDITTGPEYPASSPNVIGVGGTNLRLNGSNLRSSEVPWNDLPNSATGGGPSLYETIPSFQASYTTSTTRVVPDVAMSWGDVAIYDSNDNTGSGAWELLGGTSLSAPMFAGLTAIVNQGRAHNGLLPYDTSSLHTAMYDLPASNYYDVTSGGNGLYSAGTGYDNVTGRGVPVANNFASALASRTSNLVTNGDFERGNLNTWGWTPGYATIVGSPGSYTAQVSGNGGQLFQGINNLLPNTTYQITVTGAVTGGSAVFTASGYGSSTLTSDSWTTATGSPKTLIFTTDSSAGKVDLYLEHFGATGAAYFDNVRIVPLNQAENLDFELGNLTDWSTYGTTATVGTGVAAPTGTYGADVVAVPSGSTIYQTITGLRANTTYTISVWGRADAGQTASLVVQNYGGSSVGPAYFTTNSWSQGTLTFTTGSTNTSVQIVLAGTYTSGTYGYFDDVNLIQVY